MKEKILKLINECDDLIAKAMSSDEVNAVKIKFLGKNGELTALMKQLKSFPKEEIPLIGKDINDGRTKIQEIISAKENALKEIEEQKRLASEKIDITMPSTKQERGSLHPLSLMKNKMINVFLNMGFKVVEGPEVETDYYSFQALNIPKDHPARDMQDTFYISENILLRPHTSPAQIHEMEVNKPPIKILCPGRTYRADDDATHSPMFHQIEGLVVDKKLSLCDLKGLLDEFARKIFDNDTRTRFRPSYFPFTEPSVEVDVSCTICKGKGCRICKGTGWIEVLGAGMVNRNVLINCGIDPEEYTGFAFGVGIERIAMIKYGIPDMRMLFENDIRFLKEFK